MDRKAQMMDAGTALFTSEQGFGSVLGQVKAEMESGGGTIYKAIDTDASSLPHSTGDFDLFLDFSTRWRNLYISCRIEDAGTDADGRHRYAAVFKQGDSSGRVRDYTMLTVCVILVLAMIAAPDAIRITAGILLIILIGYLWLAPSEKGQERVKDIIKALQDKDLQG